MIEKRFNYEYDVNVISGAAMLNKGPLYLGLPQAATITIQSESFANYTDCEKSLTQLLSVLSAAEASITERNYVIVTKLNPLLGGTQSTDSEEWDSRTMLRAYVADFARLKSDKTLAYAVVGQIKMTEAQVELTRLTTSQTAQ